MTKRKPIRTDAIIAHQKAALRRAEELRSSGRRQTITAEEVVGPREMYPSDEFYATQIASATRLIASGWL
jgi:hypothetical protein